MDPETDHKRTQCLSLWSLVFHLAFLKEVYLSLSDFFVEIAPVTARDDKLEGFHLRLDAQASLKEVSVQGIVRPEPDAGQAVLRLPGYPLQVILRLLRTAHGRGPERHRN